MIDKNNRYPFENLPLPYSYQALEPYIDERTMHLHHDKHLQAYIDNLNALLMDQPALQELSLQELLIKNYLLPPSLQVPIQNNAGGVFAHRFFFASLTPSPKQPEDCALFRELAQHFGSLSCFEESFRQAALSVFGSGYAWLAVQGGRLRLLTTANQGTPLPLGATPLLNADVWEHAYYLKHANNQGDYLKDFFQVVNWAEINRRFCVAT